MILEELWQTLEGETRGVPLTGIQVRRIHPESLRAVYLGFKKPDDRRVFLLRIPKDHLPAAGVLPSLRGVEPFAVMLPADAPAHGSLGLTLREIRYADVFTALVSDLSDHVARQPDDAGAVEAFLARLGKWQKFLESHSEGMGEEAQRGLYGELKFLRDHVLPRLGTDGVSAWTGARRTPQDFQFPGCAVEVKTSTAKQLQTLRISNERQLDDTHLEALFLYHLSLEPLRGTGETLPQMVAALRSLLADGSTARTQFEDALIEVGYLDAHAPRYAATGYSIRQENLFRVREGFPRLIESDLPVGVGDVTYSISVAECQHFTVAFASLDEFLLSQIQNAGSTQGSSD
jgi:hypothetical protein